MTSLSGVREAAGDNTHVEPSPSIGAKGTDGGCGVTLSKAGVFYYVHIWPRFDSSFTDGRCSGAFPLGLVTGDERGQVPAATGSGLSSFRGTTPNVPGGESN